MRLEYTVIVIFMFVFTQFGFYMGIWHMEDRLVIENARCEKGCREAAQLSTEHIERFPRVTHAHGAWTCECAIRWPAEKGEGK